ncbi:MAG: S-layer homology domain-containing protein [Oscillospiraceae bacterium]|nr:S-layer homology domain-containing protein [Oscillospiraceae bacterium]
MKKLLALVLTLVMTMSLMTVSNAATFSDDANIDYKEAVEVMAAVGVLAGDGTGAFDADGELTRAAAAKIVTYLMIGAEAAEGLTVSAAPYADVPADHWAAGYIAYLAGEGVVAGVGNGNFDPNGKLTALQFAKMLLVALKYDADLEKLVGADWSINTSKLAAKKKLFAGNNGIKVNDVATRQEAALYAFNALKAVYVEYETKGTSVKVEGVEFSSGASAAKNNTDGVNGQGQLYAMTLAEDLYGTDLRKTQVNADGYGNPANQWSYKGKVIGTFAAAPVVTFTTEFNANELIDAVEAAGATFDTAVDGAQYDVSVSFAKNGVANQPANTMAPNTTDSWLTSNAKTDFAWSAKGVKVDVFTNDDDIVNKIVVTESVFETVTGKVEDKVATKTVDERALYTTNYVIYADDEVAGFEDIFATIEEGDYVVVTADGNNQGKALKVYVPTAVTGDVSYYKAASSLTVAGTNYAMSKNYAGQVVAGDEGVTLYVDEFGYAIGSEGGSTNAASVVVLSTYSGLNADGVIVDMALVLYADGTTARVPYAYGNTGVVGFTTQPSAGNAYLYDENDDDEMVFAAIPAAQAAVTDADEGKTFAATISVLESAKSITLGQGRNFFAAGAKFIYVSQDSNLNWQFTVSDKLQDLNNVPVKAIIDADGNISTMFIMGVGAKNTVKDGSALIFIAGQDGAASKLDKNGKLTALVQYVAFIDGVAVEGFVSEDSVGAGFYENEYDTENGWYVLSGNGYVDTAEDIKTTGAETLTKAAIFSDKYITVDGNVDVELTSATKYATSIDETTISSLAELKAELNDNDPTDQYAPTATIYVVYDNETGVALYVYVTAIV